MNGLVSVTFVVIMIMTINIIMPFITFPSATLTFHKEIAMHKVRAGVRRLKIGAALELRSRAVLRHAEPVFRYDALSQRLSHYETQQHENIGSAKKTFVGSHNDHAFLSLIRHTFGLSTRIRYSVAQVFAI